MRLNEQIRYDQHVNFTGVINFRDLGGIKAKDGRMIKKGLLFRAADLTDLTDEDIDKLKEFGLKAIFDYRTAEEANKRPNPQIENVIYVRASVNRETKMNSYQSMEEYFKSGKIHTFGNELLINLYENVPVGNPSYQQLMELIKKPEMNLPLVQHCTAGRDRTGVGTMLILLTLGVEWEDIVEDFLNSNVFLEDYHNTIFDKISNFVSEEQVNQFKEQFLLQERYIKMSYENIFKHFTNVETFLEKEFGIDKKVRMRIQNYCLS